jgi:pimeloyl-ACP methyl ester carboxylesterase
MRPWMLAIAAAGVASATYQAHGDRRDARRFPPPGRLVDVGGHRLHLWCQGEASPAVVVLPALGTPSLQWVGVQRALQDHTTVCLVDRAGLGWSDPGPWPRSFGRMTDELATLLNVARIPPPYVLVGHSTGGLIARLYSARQRDRVAALVLVDSSHEDQYRRLGGPGRRDNDLLWWALRYRMKLLGVLRAGVDLGINRRLRQHAERVCPADLVDAYVAVSLTSRARRADVQEMLGFACGANEVQQEARQLGDLPITMITAGPEGRESWYAAWQELQDDLASLSVCTTRLFAAHASHHVHQDDPGFVIRAIRDAVDQARREPRSGEILP